MTQPRGPKLTKLYAMTPANVVATSTRVGEELAEELLGRIIERRAEHRDEGAALHMAIALDAAARRLSERVEAMER